jgi:hypothetical protein
MSRPLTPLALALVICLSPPGTDAAQIRADLPGGRRSTTVESLTTYPVFHHLQAVRVRGRLVTDGVGTALIGGAARVLLIGDAAIASADGEVEVLGAFVDVGRLTQDDPRVGTYNLVALSQKVLNRDWPAQGELLIVLTESVERAEPFVQPTLRALALEPERYDGQTVTVAGRFRGRNLFGDQPASPGRSRFDFIVQLADASVWVVGRQARADGVDLRVDRRMDTGRWLEVRGDVRTARGLVWIEAIDIRGAAPVAEPETEEVTAPALLAPAPTVVFSAPTADELDVSPTATVRVQFSRDMRADSFKGNVRVRYLARESAERGEPQPPPVAVTTTYDAGRRVLELKFAAPLERFRTVEIELADGITATDEQPLVPWRLRFTVGG